MKLQLAALRASKSFPGLPRSRSRLAKHHCLRATLPMFAKAIVAWMLACVSTVSFAGASCTENITSAILHSNGNVYFLSDKTCNATWCQINWGTDDKNKKALAMLLLAKATNKPVTFYWSNLGSCSEVNPVYSSPAYMSLD